MHKRLLQTWVQCGTGHPWEGPHPTSPRGKHRPDVHTTSHVNLVNLL